MSPLSIFITIVVILLIFMILKYIFTEPYTLQGMKSAQTATTISASELATNGTDVPSNNFAYSIWFYVNDWNYRYGSPKVIFGRMGALSASTTGSVSGIGGVDPCPLVLLTPLENNLAISLACFPGSDQQSTDPSSKSIVHTCAVGNIPIQKWVNLLISVYGRTLDVYIDGKLVKTCLLPGIAKINNKADIYVTPAGGFDGWTSNLQYFPNSLNPQQAWNIYSKGYGSGIFSNLMNSYEIQISLLENGTVQSTTTI